MNFMEISSKDNANIKLVRKLFDSRKARREQGMFMLEGARLVQDALKENAELHFVLFTHSALEKAENGEGKYGEALNLLENVRNAPRAFVIPDDLGEKLSATEGTQGIFAVCGIPDNGGFSDNVKSGGKYVVLHTLQDPGNMGTVIRTADALGVDGIAAVGCCDIYNPKTVRSAMGALMRMPVCEVSEDEMFAAFAGKNIRTFASVVSGDAVSVKECGFSGGAAVLIGNEGSGLTAETSEKCSERITIKMHGTAESLNAAAAASILMWELMNG